MKSQILISVAVGVFSGGLSTYIAIRAAKSRKTTDWEAHADALYRAACGHDRPMKAVNAYLAAKRASDDNRR